MTGMIQAVPAMGPLLHMSHSAPAGKPAARHIRLATSSHHASDDVTSMFALPFLAVPAFLYLPLSQSRERLVVPTVAPLDPWPPPEQPPRTI